MTMGNYRRQIRYDSSAENALKNLYLTPNALDKSHSLKIVQFWNPASGKIVLPLQGLYFVLSPHDFPYAELGLYFLKPRLLCLRRDS